MTIANAKMFGHRCLVEFFRPKSSKSAIIIPDAAQQHDTHRFGRVIALGDGKVRGKSDQAPVVALGDIAMFQINKVMEDTQKYVLNGKPCMNLHQGDIIGRLKSEEVSFDNFEVVGDFVMLKHFFRQAEGSRIVLPDDVLRHSAPDFIYFNVVKMGGSVDKEFTVGDEVVANLGRLTPLFFVERHENGTSKNVEYCYTHQDWIDGVVK